MKKQKGITLIALVISIIIMLILAGVSINAIVGDNGILTKAQNAKLTAEEATRRENLELLMFDYNSSKFLGSEDGLNKYLDTLVGANQIDSFAATTDGDYAIITYQGKTYEVARESENSEYYEVLDEVANDLGDLSGNYVLTQKTLDSTDNFAFEDKKEYVILDKKLTGDDFEFNIPDNTEVTIKVLYDMAINNKGVERSAINLGNNAILNLYVYGTVEVNSGYGEKGETANKLGAKGGPGGYAGIHVPKTATLNLYGTGTIVCYGGDAGDGGGATTSNTGGGGGGGAGAGIGGNGGKGGDANSTFQFYKDASGKAIIGYDTNSGRDGEKGEDCGNVNILDNIEVYAYGGGGGGGGFDASTENGSGSGAGGYPAAGIGGGRCWWRWRRPLYASGRIYLW